MVNTDDLWQKIKERIKPTEQSVTNLPVGMASSDVAEIFREMMSVRNIFQTAYINETQQLMISVAKAYKSYGDNMELFLEDLVYNLMETSVSVDGMRNEMIRDIAVGQLSQSFQMKLAQMRGVNMDKGLKEIV